MVIVTILIFVVLCFTHFEKNHRNSMAQWQKAKKSTKIILMVSLRFQRQQLHIKIFTDLLQKKNRTNPFLDNLSLGIIHSFYS